MPRNPRRRVLPALCSLMLLAVTAAACPPGASPAASGFSGGRAFGDLKKMVSFGPRPAGSQAIVETRQWIIGQLEQAGVNVEEDSFMASTPIGQMKMVNLIAKFPGTKPGIVMVTGHYDTARIPNVKFVGANDGASSAALLIELARVLAKQKHQQTIWLVFFDGEEAQQQWSNTDGLYGSRHMVQQLSASGELSRVEAMILVDMIGGEKLSVYREYYSTPWLQDVVFKAAHSLGYARYFHEDKKAIDDDHIPFIDAGVSATDIIGLEYGPGNEPFGSYWHTAQDTIEHCSPISLTIVGRVVLETLAALEKSPQLK